MKESRVILNIWNYIDHFTTSINDKKKISTMIYNLNNIPI